MLQRPLRSCDAKERFDRGFTSPRGLGRRRKSAGTREPRATLREPVTRGLPSGTEDACAPQGQDARERGRPRINIGEPVEGTRSLFALLPPSSPGLEGLLRLAGPQPQHQPSSPDRTPPPQDPMRSSPLPHVSETPAAALFLKTPRGTRCAAAGSGL